MAKTVSLEVVERKHNEDHSFLQIVMPSVNITFTSNESIDPREATEKIKEIKEILKSNPVFNRNASESDLMFARIIAVHLYARQAAFSFLSREKYKNGVAAKWEKLKVKFTKPEGYILKKVLSENLKDCLLVSCYVGKTYDKDQFSHCINGETFFKVNFDKYLEYQSQSFDLWSAIDDINETLELFSDMKLDMPKEHEITIVSAESQKPLSAEKNQALINARLIVVEDCLRQQAKLPQSQVVKMRKEYREITGQEWQDVN